MIKGWRNDPSWIEHYSQRDKERSLRELTLMKIRTDIERELYKTELAIDRMKLKVPVAKIY